MKRTVFIILVLLMVFCAVPSYAQLFVEQAKVNLTIKPGETQTGVITIHNTANASQNVRTYWSDFIYKAPYDGAKEFMPVGSTPASAGSWVTFTPAQFDLEPQGKMEVYYTVNPPKELKGGYYGVLFFETQPGTMKNQGTMINVVTRVGCLFFLESDNKQKKAFIENPTVEQNKLNFKLANQGDVVIIGHPLYYFMSSDGMISDRGELENLYIPPGESAPFSIPVNANVPLGDQILDLTVDLQDGDTAVKEVDLNKASETSIQITKISD